MKFWSSGILTGNQTASVNCAPMWDTLELSVGGIGLLRLAASRYRVYHAR